MTTQLRFIVSFIPPINSCPAGRQKAKTNGRLLLRKNKSIRIWTRDVWFTKSLGDNKVPTRRNNCVTNIHLEIIVLRQSDVFTQSLSSCWTSPSFGPTFQWNVFGEMLFDRSDRFQDHILDHFFRQTLVCRIFILSNRTCIEFLNSIWPTCNGRFVIGLINLWFTS